MLTAQTPEALASAMARASTSGRSVAAGGPGGRASARLGFSRPPRALTITGRDPRRRIALAAGDAAAAAQLASAARRLIAIRSPPWPMRSLPSFLVRSHLIRAHRRKVLA